MADTTGRAMTVRVGIIGSGPAGLTTALALEKTTDSAHAELTLLDRNHTAVDYPGVEYGIQSRACRALERLGLMDAALTVGNPGEHIVLRVARKAKDQKRIRINPKYTYAVYRPEFLENLSKLLRRTEIQRECNVTRIEPSGHGRVVIRSESGYGNAIRSREFDLVVACDGVHSVARRTYFPDAGTHDRGFSAIYLLAMGDPADSRTPDNFPMVANGGTSEIILGTFVTSALFPLGRHRLAIAMGFDHPTRDRLWHEHGLRPDTSWESIAAPTKASIAQTLAQNTPVHDCLIERALALVDDWDSPRVYLWPMRDSDPLPHPYAPDCNLVLVGDSCHAFLPTIGMGASLAMEDAECLGQRLGQHLHQVGDLPNGEASLASDVFEPWAKVRRPVWDDLMRRARMAAHNWIHQSELHRFDLAPMVPTRIGSSLVGIVDNVLDHRQLGR